MPKKQSKKRKKHINLIPAVVWDWRREAWVATRNIKQNECFEVPPELVEAYEIQKSCNYKGKIAKNADEAILRMLISK